MDESTALGISATGAHEITKLYGLKIRTRTAVINASILPKMVETAEMTEKSVLATGIKAPLMVMRGDGGVMSIGEMRRRPILTALSGPAASVAGVLFYLRVSDGIYFEVGGTSTNIGVIKNGRPMTKHVEVGGHSTYLPSLDVRVLGVAGGSMPRLQGTRIIDVGPRSAHIAGLPYAAFAKTEEIESPKLVYLKLKKGDPGDYVGIETAYGKRFALTNTCAANVLGMAKEGDYAFGNPEAARKAFRPLAEALNVSLEEAARQFLEASTNKVIKVVTSLIDEYELDERASVLVGGGGGAAALIPFISDKTNLKYQISTNAEVISSIGDALAMVRETVERSIMNPTPEDILKVRKECEQGAIASGAVPGSIEIYVEVDSVKNRVIATAMGATEFVAKCVAIEKIPEGEQVKVAAASMRVDCDDVKESCRTRNLAVYTAPIKKRGLFGITRIKQNAIRVVDQCGVVRLTVGDGIAFPTTVENALEMLVEQGKKLTRQSDGGPLVPSAYLLYEARVFDMSGLKSLEEYEAMARMELQGLDGELPAALIFSTQW
jgi:N-methylhydantoinase A/oxoprolinase/acetone carboxylase beta subunit